MTTSVPLAVIKNVRKYILTYVKLFLECTQKRDNHKKKNKTQKKNKLEFSIWGVVNSLDLFMFL